MATREEIVDGLQMTVEQGKRTTALYGEGEWDAARPAGWTPKQIYQHLGAVAGIVPQLAQGLMGAPEDLDIAQGMNINEMNEQAVAGAASASPEQIMVTFEENYGKLIEFVKSLPDDQLHQKRRFLSESIPVSDILATSIMLHGLHHVYEAQNRLAGP